MELVNEKQDNENCAIEIDAAMTENWHHLPQTPLVTFRAGVYPRVAHRMIGLALPRSQPLWSITCADSWCCNLCTWQV